MAAKHGGSPKDRGTFSWSRKYGLLFMETIKCQGQFQEEVASLGSAVPVAAVEYDCTVLGGGGLEWYHIGGTGILRSTIVLYIYIHIFLGGG